jgi:peptidoglycan/LPS O-acetylase OafA/YrhL
MLMIQRKQSIWLLIAAASAGLSFIFPFYTVADHTSGDWTKITAQSSFLSVISGGAVVLGSLVALFLYKRLKNQFWMVVLSLVLALLHLLLLYTHSLSYQKGNPALTALVPAAAIVFLLMAARDIRKDEKTLKELNSNRLR